MKRPIAAALTAAMLAGVSACASVDLPFGLGRRMPAGTAEEARAAGTFASYAVQKAAAVARADAVVHVAYSNLGSISTGVTVFLVKGRRVVAYQVDGAGEVKRIAGFSPDEGARRPADSAMRVDDLDLTKLDALAADAQKQCARREAWVHLVGAVDGNPLAVAGCTEFREATSDDPTTYRNTLVAMLYDGRDVAPPALGSGDDVVESWRSWKGLLGRPVRALSVGREVGIGPGFAFYLATPGAKSLTGEECETTILHVPGPTGREPGAGCSATTPQGELDVDAIDPTAFDRVVADSRVDLGKRDVHISTEAGRVVFAVDLGSDTRHYDAEGTRR